MNKLFFIIPTLYAIGSALAAGLPTPQDVEDQLKKLYPNMRGAEMFPKGNQFEVLFLSPDRPTSCLVDVATHQISNCHYDDVEFRVESRSSDRAIYYVANTRPPDAYLALRTDPTSSFGRRVMTMPNGTRLQVLRRRDDGWWYVQVLPSGEVGWTLSRQGNQVWIECCASDAVPQQTLSRLYTPQVGSPERAAIMDAIRLATNWTIKFKVSHLFIARQGNKAIAVSEVSDASSPPRSSVSGSRWHRQPYANTLQGNR